MMRKFISQLLVILLFVGILIIPVFHEGAQSQKELALEPKILSIKSDELGKPNVLWAYTYSMGDSNEVWDLIEDENGTIIGVGVRETNYPRDPPTGTDYYEFTKPAGSSSASQLSLGTSGIEKAFSTTLTTNGWRHTIGLISTNGGFGGTDILLQSDGPGERYVIDTVYGGFDDDVGWSIANASGNDLAIVGSTMSFGSGEKDVWLLYSAEDNFHIGLNNGARTYLSWNRTYGGIEDDEAYSIIICKSGGFAFAGYTKSYGSGAKDGWLIRTDKSGNVYWNETFGGTGDDTIQSIIECRNGDFAMVGTTQSMGSGSDDIWLLRTNSTGHVIWQHTFGGLSSDFGMDLVESSNGCFALVGYTYSFGGGMDAWFIQVNSDGSLIAKQTFGGPLDDCVRAIVDLSDETFAIAGYTESYAENIRDAWLLRIGEMIPPRWIESPIDQTIEVNTAFYYDLDASDASGIAIWQLNDTSNFQINTHGVIQNATSLKVGKYGLHVQVYDVHNNSLVGVFSVYVTDTMMPSNPDSMGYLLIGSGVVVVLALVSFSRMRRVPKYTYTN